MQRQTHIKKIILIPDSFKGTMSSKKICNIMEMAIKKQCTNANIISIPVADGGEGSVDAFLSSLGGKKIYVNVTGPKFKTIKSFYGILADKKTAVIEMASCAGLPLVEKKPNPETTTTYGCGELILDALAHGCTKIIMGLGGSATNDAGCGMVAALGVRFFGKNKKEFIPVGKTLRNILHIDMSHLDQRLRKIKIITMCDIDNPLFGQTGAAFVFAPQKGADAKMVSRLDEGLKHLASIVKLELGKDKSQLQGAGAAGGMGYAMNVFLNSKLQSGIETVLDTVGFDKIAKDADFVFSGEGKIDEQSLHGKVIAGIAKRCKKAKVPLIAIVGDIGDGIEKLYSRGVSAIFSINRVAVDYKIARLRAEKDLHLTVENIMRFIKTVQR